MTERSLFISIILVLFWVVLLDGQDVQYRVVDRRQMDGSVILVRKVPPRRLGRDPFSAADFWKLIPVSEFFRVRSGRVPARYVSSKGDPPAITFEAGEVVPNSWTNLFGEFRLSVQGVQGWGSAGGKFRLPILQFKKLFPTNSLSEMSTFYSFWKDRNIYPDDNCHNQ